MMTLPAPSRPQPKTIAAGTAALLLAALLLIPGLNAFSLWYDEVMVYNAARALEAPDDLYALEGQPARIVHPPLFFVLLRGWMLLAGDSDFALRAITVLLALIGAAFVFRLAADLAGRSFGGLAAVAALATSGFDVYYVHQMHNYSLLLATAAALLFVYQRWIRRGGRRYALGVALATAALLYTHYYGLFLILAINVHALCAALLRRRGLVAWTLTQAGALLLYLPWLPVIAWLAGGGYQTSTEYEGVAVNSMTVEQALNLLLYDGLPVYALVTGLALGYAVWHWRRALLPLALLVSVTVLSLGLALLGNEALLSFSARRVIFVLVPLAALFGWALSAAPPALAWAGLTLTLILTPNEPLPPGLPGNWFFRESVAHIAARADPADAVLIAYSGALETPSFAYYARRTLTVPVFFPTDDAAARRNTFWPRPRLWVIHAVDQPVTWDETLAQKQYTAAETMDFARMRVSLYTARVPARTIPAEARPVTELLPQTFGDLFELSAVHVSALSARPSDRLEVWLDWRTLRPSAETWGVFVHLIEDDLTTLHSQTDGSPSHLGRDLPTPFWPVGVTIADHYTITVQSDTPPGVYNLRIGLYSYSRPERLPAAPGDGSGATDGLIIARIEINN